jgi:hypothetical protein
MPDLENESFDACQIHQLSALVNIGCDRLLDQNIYTPFEEITRNFKV